jgi:FAD synthase
MMANPQEENREKIVEAHLLGEFSSDFYGNEMRLILAGQQRPEQKFPSFPELLAAIKQVHMQQGMFCMY